MDSRKRPIYNRSKPGSRTVKDFCLSCDENEVGDGQVYCVDCQAKESDES